MKLGAYLTVIVMGDPDYFLIECKAFFVKKRFAEMTFSNRNVSDNDHSAAASCNPVYFFKVIFIR